MSNEYCRVCANESLSPIFSGPLLSETINYFECDHCGYVQTEYPFWQSQAYNSIINTSDTGILSRNLTNLAIVQATMSLLGDRRGTVVDCAGGYGILVRLLRDAGVDAYWADPYCENLLARGFEYNNQNATLVTAFEAIEHFINPVEELEKFFTIGPNLLVSTLLIPKPTPNLNDWWYYGTEHGQHIGFLRYETLVFLARRFGKHLTSDGHSYHLFTQRPVHLLRWKLERRLARLAPRLYRLGIESKTWSDHETLKKNK